MNWIYQKPAIVFGLIFVLIVVAVEALNQDGAVLEFKSIAASKTAFGEVRDLDKRERGGFRETQGPFSVSIVIELKQPAAITVDQRRSDGHIPEAG